MLNYTQIPNWILSLGAAISNAEFRVLCDIYRLTAGYHRKSYKITYLELSKMSGIKNISIIVKSLKEKGYIYYEYQKGKANVITILQPSKLLNQSDKKVIKSVNRSHSVSESHSLSNLTSYRGAKENIKENLNKDIDVLINKYNGIYNRDKVIIEWNNLSLVEQQKALESLEHFTEIWKFNSYYKPHLENFIRKKVWESDPKCIEFFESKRKHQHEEEKSENLKKEIEENEKNAASDEVKNRELGRFLNRKKEVVLLNKDE